MPLRLRHGRLCWSRGHRGLGVWRPFPDYVAVMNYPETKADSSSREREAATNSPASRQAARQPSIMQQGLGFSLQGWAAGAIACGSDLGPDAQASPPLPTPHLPHLPQTPKPRPPRAWPHPGLTSPSPLSRGLQMRKPRCRKAVTSLVLSFPPGEWG